MYTREQIETAVKSKGYKWFENGDYNVDHSSPVILLKDGKYIARISHKDDVKRSIKILNKHL